MSISEAEREIFARLRGLAARVSGEQLRDELMALATPASAPLPCPDPLEALLANLRRNGASAVAVADRAGAVAEIASYIATRYPQRRVVCGHDPRLAALPWRDGGLLPRFGVAGATDRAAVSYARCAIAETGSLAVLISRDNPALNNLLCEDHLVLVDRADLRRSLTELWEFPELAGGAARPRGLMMISGPSSTADIAMQLVLGAHGPRALHVIVVGANQSGL